MLISINSGISESVDHLKKMSIELVNSLLEQIRQQAVSKYAEIFHLSEVYSVENRFAVPYWFVENFATNPEMYKFVSGGASKIQTANMVRVDDSAFLNRYLELLKRIVYNISADERRTLDQVNTESALQKNALVEAYVANVDSDIIKQCTGNKLYLQISVEIGKWTSNAAAKKNIWNALAVARDPATVLDQTPVGGEQIYVEIANYARALGNGRNILGGAAYFTSILQDVIAQSQSKTPSPVFRVDPHIPDIVSGLNNTSSSISLTVEVHKATEDKLTVSVNGNASLTIPIVSWFVGNIGGGASYDYSKDITSNFDAKIEMTFTGVTAVQFGTENYDENTSSGWFEPHVISQARSNIGKNTDSFSGYNFLSAPSEDDFNLRLAVMLISQNPSFEMTVNTSNSSNIVEQWKTKESAGFTLFGLFSFGASSSQDSYKSDFQSTATGFTVKYSPPPPSGVSVQSFDKTAYLIGVSPTDPYV